MRGLVRGLVRGLLGIDRFEDERGELGRVHEVEVLR